jgi:hypothetical protein
VVVNLQPYARLGVYIQGRRSAPLRGSLYRSGRSKDWLKSKNSEAPAVKREAEEDWGKRRPNV